MRWFLRTEREIDPTGEGDTTLGKGAGTACGHDVESSGDTGPLDLVELARCIAREDRSEAPPGRPWIMVNMVASVDGAAAGPDTRTASLSGPADRALFRVLRSIADVVLAGAGTVRAENYGAAKLPAELVEARVARGQPPRPRMAVASGSLRLDPTARFFTDAPADQRPIVLTAASPVANPAAREDLAAVAEIHEVGERSIDWPTGFGLLRDHYGANIVLVEGGPTLNAQLVEYDLIDELCLCISPQFLGGPALRIVAGGNPPSPLRLRLDRVVEDDSFLFLRYLRA